MQGEVISHNPFSQREYIGSNKNSKKVINQLAGDPQERRNTQLKWGCPIFISILSHP